MLTLPDPEYCRRCKIHGRVIESRRVKLGYRRRRHRCPHCGHRWTSWQMVLNPRRMRLVKG